MVITDIVSSADASRRQYSNRNDPVLESRFELRAAPTFCNFAGHGLSYARELRRTGKMAQSNGTTTSLIIQNNSSEFLPGSEFDQYVLQTYSLSSNGRVYTNLPNGLLAKALEELKMKPHIQYETIHMHTLKIMQTSLNLMMSLPKTSFCACYIVHLVISYLMATN